jgi:hypothetical protein
VEEDYIDRYEPDDFEEYNRNEADDYRHELDGDELPDFGGPVEEDADEWGGEFEDSCPVCHEPWDCCTHISDCWNCNTRYLGSKCPKGCDDIPEEVRHQVEATWRVEGREPPMRFCHE